MALLLHELNLLEQLLIVLLHVLYFQLERVFLASIVVPTLFHLAQLHLCPLQVIRHFLHLLLVSVVVLQLMNEFLELVYRLIF